MHLKKGKSVFRRNGDIMVQVLITFSCQRRGSKQDLPCRLPGDFRIHKLEKTVGEMKLETFVNSALFCVMKGLVLRNTI